MLDELFRNINVPILLYQEGPEPSIVYGNRSAITLLRSEGFDETGQWRDEENPSVALFQIPREDKEKLIELYHRRREIVGFGSNIRLHWGGCLPVSISANRMEYRGTWYVKLCIYPVEAEQMTNSHAQALAAALNTAYQSQGSREAIDRLLAFAGHYFDVLRVSVFESHSEATISNSFEWCALGTKARIDKLQKLPRADSAYDLIIQKALVLDDERALFLHREGELEERMHASIAIPILSVSEPLGYLVLSAGAKQRTWMQEEICFLRDLSDLLASLLERRNVEQSLQYSLEILNTVTEHFDTIVFVYDMQSGEILFASQGFAAAIDVPRQELNGRNINQLLTRIGRSEKEDPRKAMLDADGRIEKARHTWEFQHQGNHKWYLVRNAIIKWIDGRDVLIETATEITKQKEYEARLEYEASTDMMTGIYNREWGRKLVEKTLENMPCGGKVSLVFMDLDGLKRINDHYGHVAGDQMIIETVKLVKNMIRKSDTLFRWGGDEFVLLLHATEEESQHVMDKIMMRAREHNRCRDNPFDLRFSYGIVEIQEGAPYTLDGLIREADQKMYANKTKEKLS